MRKMHKRKGLRWSMIKVLTLVWLVPLMLLSIGMLIVMVNKNSKQIEETILVSTKKAIESSVNKMNTVIRASKDASYIPTIKESYQQYLKDGNKTQLYIDVTQFLNQQYRYNDMIQSTMLYFIENPERVYYTYSNVAGATYSSVGEFKNNAQATIMKESEASKTGTKFVNVNNKLYLMRNMVTSTYDPYAVIVMEINMQALFESLQSIVWYVDSMVYVDDGILVDSKTGNMVDYQYYLDKPVTKEPILYEDKEAVVVISQKVESQYITYMIKLDKVAIVNENDIIIYMFIIFMLFMIPLVIIIFYFFHKNVSQPISKLVLVSQEIEKGNFEVRLPALTQNAEFNYLGETFNSMLVKLQMLFEKIYLEEIALRDANIMALQAQINPHFLNNTLEIINWEARLSDNDKLSQMIEALATMMEATMNRKEQSLIPLYEELSYIDAYLYIISQRFGGQFEVTKEIDEQLLEVQVPRLIIQPIMENAVEYGMDDYGKRKVLLKVYQKEDKIFIQIKDNGTLTLEDQAKIDNLLNDKQDRQEEKSSLNLGIYNVNKRLKIIYGESCGLTLQPDEDGRTLSIITINNKPFSQ